jgi:hypothetical protein
MIDPVEVEQFEDGERIGTKRGPLRVVVASTAALAEHCVLIGYERCRPFCWTDACRVQMRGETSRSSALASMRVLPRNTQYA